MRLAHIPSRLAEYTPSEIILLFPDCISLSFPDAFAGSQPALVSGRHVDAANVTPRLVRYALAALVSRGDLTLSLHETTSRVLGIRETSVLMHSSTPPSEWPAGSLEARLLAAAAQEGGGADLAYAIESCIACVSGSPHLVFYKALMQGLEARGVIEAWTQRRMLLFRMRRWRLAEEAHASLSEVSAKEVADFLTSFEDVNESLAPAIVGAHDLAITRCTDNGT